MAEFKETYLPDGCMKVALVEPRLPAGMFCRMHVHPTRGTQSITQANGKGSRRYHFFPSYEQAQAHALAWAARKIAGR